MSRFLPTIDPNKDRYLLGQIQRCQVLTEEQANDAHEQLEKAGMMKQMTEDILAVGGNPDVLLNEKKCREWMLDMINIRYQPQHLVL